MPKCPQCPQFTSKDTDTDPEVNLDIDQEDGRVTGTVRLVNTCAECGEELEEFEFEVDITDDDGVIAKHLKAHKKEDTHHLTVEEDSCTRTDEMKRTDRRGKPIKNHRYMKRLLGFQLTATVTCSCSNTWSVIVSQDDHTNAGSFESMV